MLSSDREIQTFGIGAPERNPSLKIRETIHGKSLIVDIDGGHGTLAVEAVHVYMMRYERQPLHTYLPRKAPPQAVGVPCT